MTQTIDRRETETTRIHYRPGAGLYGVSAVAETITFHPGEGPVIVIGHNPGDTWINQTGGFATFDSMLGPTGLSNPSGPPTLPTPPPPKPSKGLGPDRPIGDGGEGRPKPPPPPAGWMPRHRAVEPVWAWAAAGAGAMLILIAVLVSSILAVVL